MRRHRVLLADDHKIVTEGLVRVLEPEFDLVEVVEDGEALVEAAQRHQPDVIVADISMPRLSGIEALGRLRERDPEVRVVILTMHRESSYAKKALAAGAVGYVLKHSATTELVDAIQAALRGETYVSPRIAGELLKDQGKDDQESPVILTARQKEILKLLAEGLSAKEIASRLDISPRTVEFHKYRMMETLEVHTSAELILYAIKTGIATV